MIDLREDLGDLKAENVDVPEWGGSIKIKEMGGLSRMSFELEWGKLSQKGPDLARGFALLLVYSVVDEEGKHPYSLNDVDLIADRNPEVLMRIFNVAARINGLDATAVKDSAKK